MVLSLPSISSERFGHFEQHLFGFPEFRCARPRSVAVKANQIPMNFGFEEKIARTTPKMTSSKMASNDIGTNVQKNLLAQVHFSSCIQLVKVIVF